MSYGHSIYETPCPQCKGVKAVTWVSWGSDCRGNDPGYSINCSQCEATYTSEVWRAIAAKEIKKIVAKRKKEDHESKRRWKAREA